MIWTEAERSMDEGNSLLTSRQLGMLLWAGMISPLIRQVPGVMTDFAGGAAWLSALLCVPAAGMLGLFTAVGGQDSAGTALKSTGGWFNDGNGTDAFGFSALPAGDRGSNGGCNYEGLNAYFWSSTEYDSNYAYNVLLYVNFDYAYLDYGNKDYGFSVRCLKD